MPLWRPRWARSRYHSKCGMIDPEATREASRLLRNAEVCTAGGGRYSSDGRTAVVGALRFLASAVELAPH